MFGLMIEALSYGPAALMAGAGMYLLGVENILVYLELDEVPVAMVMLLPSIIWVGPALPK